MSCGNYTGNKVEQLEVSEHNRTPHLDIEEEAQSLKNGLYTFVVRVADCKIVDVVFLSYESYENATELDFS